jgi:hypothetical protein
MIFVRYFADLRCSNANKRESMMLVSLTHISLMKRRYKVTPTTWRMTCSDFLPSKVLKGKFYFLTTSSECFYLVQILFCLLDVKCVFDELCMRVCSYHWILLKIQFDTSSVVILDSLDKSDVLFSDMKAMLQK